MKRPRSKTVKRKGSVPKGSSESKGFNIMLNSRNRNRNDNTTEKLI